jgi:hypothetical protein
LYSDTGTAPCVCAGRDLPAGAVRALSATEKLVSLKQYKDLARKLTEAQRAESRRVLVAYLPVSCGLWQVRRAAASGVHGAQGLGLGWVQGKVTVAAATVQCRPVAWPSFVRADK